MCFLGTCDGLRNFKCKYGRYYGEDPCISEYWVNDGYKDCKFRTDEITGK